MYFGMLSIFVVYHIITTRITIFFLNYKFLFLSILLGQKIKCPTIPSLTLTTTIFIYPKRSLTRTQYQVIEVKLSYCIFLRSFLESPRHGFDSTRLPLPLPTSPPWLTKVTSPEAAPATWTRCTKRGRGTPNPSTPHGMPTSREYSTWHHPHWA